MIPIAKRQNVRTMDNLWEIGNHKNFVLWRTIITWSKKIRGAQKAKGSHYGSPFFIYKPNLERYTENCRLRTLDNIIASFMTASTLKCINIFLECLLLDQNSKSIVIPFPFQIKTNIWGKGIANFSRDTFAGRSCTLVTPSARYKPDASLKYPQDPCTFNFLPS